MRRFLSAAAVVLLSGCGGGATDTTAPSESATPAPSSSTPAVSYTDLQLMEALPQDPTQMHGPITEECRDLKKACDYTTSPSGFVMVQSTPKDDDLDFKLVLVTTRLNEKGWKNTLAGCPQGAYSIKPQKDGDRVMSGQRGTATRADYAIGSWKGFSCAKKFVHVRTDGDSHPISTTEVRLRLDNKMVLTRGTSMAESKQLAVEYLERLEEAASGSAG